MQYLSVGNVKNISDLLPSGLPWISCKTMGSTKRLKYANELRAVLNVNALAPSRRPWRWVFWHSLYSNTSTASSQHSYLSPSGLLTFFPTVFHLLHCRSVVLSIHPKTARQHVQSGEKQNKTCKWSSVSTALHRAIANIKAKNVFFWRQLMSEIRPDLTAASGMTCTESQQAVPPCTPALLPASLCTTKAGQVTHSSERQSSGWRLLHSGSRGCAPTTRNHCRLGGCTIKEAEHHQLLLGLVEAPHRAHKGRFQKHRWRVRAPLAVSVCLVSLPGSSVLSSLPSLWHLWDTNSCLVCGITSSSSYSWHSTPTPLLCG